MAMILAKTAEPIPINNTEAWMENILKKIEKLMLEHDAISPELIKKKDIKLGLRNPDGSGVVAGITSKGIVIGYEKIPNPDGTFTVKPVEGKLYYCGYDACELAQRIQEEGRYGFDEVTYLLLTGELPDKKDLERFEEVIADRRPLNKLERSIIMQEDVNYNQMYALHSVISHLSRCDPDPDSTDIKDVSRQCINIIAKAPVIIAYNYNVMKFRKGGDLFITKPNPEWSTAENFLYMLRGERPDEYEAKLFDLALMLHAEHGGGNNSTFAVRTVTSSGANTYMALCAGVASLSGHLHGGANEAVMKMMKDIKQHVKDWEDDEEVEHYLKLMLEKKAYDKSGKIYGIGHAVYTKSDPRAIIFRQKAEEYARMKKNLDEFNLFAKVADIGSRLVQKYKGTVASPNVDFYSGLIYKMMGIPMELFTPIFAMARFSGWSAHRIEQIIHNKIIRPAYTSSLDGYKEYIPLAKR
jgi:citrate synthase